jgi:PiT family inorganic phosphate transporter
LILGLSGRYYIDMAGIGVCRETVGAITLFLATFLGIPVSTTHTITGAIIGVGAAR